MSDLSKRYAGLLWKSAGAIVLALSCLLYMIGDILVSQIRLARVFGVFEILSVNVVLAAALVAAIALALRLDAAKPVLRRTLRTICYLLFVGNIAAIGLTIFFLSPAQAPKLWKLGAAIAVAVLGVAFWRYDEREQRFLSRFVLGTGLAALVLPLLAAPWVAFDAWQDASRRPWTPQPPASPRLRANAPKRIVLVTFDSLRARSTTLTTPALDTTPNLVALSHEATWFSRFHSAADQTRVSFPTIFTGVAPYRIYRHVYARGGSIRPDAVYGMAAYLRDAGYETDFATMFVAPGVLGMRHEFDQGRFNAQFLQRAPFNTRDYLPLAQTYRWLFRKVTHQVTPGQASPGVLETTRLTLEQGRDYLREAKRPVFLWIHLAVPHAPYYPVPRAQIGTDPQDLDVTPFYIDTSKGPAELALGQKDYEDYIRFGDYQLGRFLRELKQDGLWQDTMLIVSADHGEEFIPNRDIHGNGILTEDVTHVPLLIHLPGEQTGKRVDSLCGQIDLLPTVLSQVYARVPSQLRGLPLFGPLPDDRVVYSWGLFGRKVERNGQPENVAAYYHQFKYVFQVPTGKGWLYDLASDPDARRDVLAQHPELATMLQRDLRAEMHL
ncbi:MAG TPA: sulfatase-like hydrolase/transferase [Oscillatoriaceae cyanobacterium]